jgi:hypothetical protein
MKKTATALIPLIICILAFNECNANQTTGNNTFPTQNCTGGDVINGFTMPPCPDQALNDSTLLGIDSNNNGVRDDVERWLINRYKNDHKIVTEIGFQGARASQIVIQNPDEAGETYHIEGAALYCNSYFKDFADIDGGQILIDHIIINSTAFRSVQFNTAARIRAYLTYNKKLSGGVYEDPIKSYKSFCDFDVNKTLGD